MSGNDIVDIALAEKESKWKRKGFLEKVFTPQEQYFINKAGQPSVLVWQFWSMKESAYKIYTRQCGGRFFAPDKIECKLLTSRHGQVTIHQRNYNTYTTVTENYIYSVARPFDSIASIFHSKCFYNHQNDETGNSHLIHEKIIDFYAAITGKEKTKLTLLKHNNNIPDLFCTENRTKIPVSITHHGNYAAFTIN